jgi:hypothetical protein
VPSFTFLPAQFPFVTKLVSVMAEQLDRSSGQHSGRKEPAMCPSRETCPIMLLLTKTETLPLKAAVKT